MFITAPTDLSPPGKLLIPLARADALAELPPVWIAVAALLNSLISPFAIAGPAPIIPLISFTALPIAVIASSALVGISGSEVATPVISVLISLKTLFNVFIGLTIEPKLSGIPVANRVVSLNALVNPVIVATAFPPN